MKLAVLLLLSALLPPSSLAQQYTQTTFAEAGITLNTKVYTINAINSGNNADTQRGSITVNSAGTALTRTTTPNAADKNQQFVFITETNDNTSEVYLYNLGTKLFAKLNGGNAPTLVNGSNTPSPIYVYPTNNSEFNHAFAFSPSVTYYTSGSHNASGNYVLSISGGDVRTISYSTLDNGNRWRLAEPAGVTFTNADLLEARRILQGVTINGPFHKKGASNRNLMANGMQDVAEVNYYYYVNADTYDNGYNDSGNFRHGIELSLPFYDYNGYPDNGNYNGNNMEPYAYFRWFDYRTDRMPTGSYVSGGRTIHRIAAYSSDNLHEIHDTLLNDYGLIAYNMSSGNGPNLHNVGVIYNIPDSANDANWSGDVIACDVSRYCDYNDTTIVDRARFDHEPTLSVRYIFHILPARKLANDMEQTLLGGAVEGNDKTLSDKAMMVFGAKDANATMSLRTDLSEIKYYYFHPLTASALQSKHVYYPDSLAGDRAFADGDFDNSQLVQAQSIEWRVYNSSMDRYRVFGTTNRHVTNGKVDKGTNINLSMSMLRGSDWKDLDGNQASNENPIDFNTTCYLVGYVVNGSNKCPFFNARLDINRTNPMSETQIAASQQSQRTTQYLSNHFGSPVAQFSFDNENSLQDHTQPESATAENNFSMEPSRFSWRQYGFTYYQLGKYSVRGNSATGAPHVGTTDTEKYIDPLHGDYILQKVRISGSTPLYDRTHEMDQSQYGYFMFTDASQESRMLGYQDFNGNLCTGSQIIVSAWVSNWSGGNGSNQPELRFALYGVHKDARGNDVSTKLIASLCSGNFVNNIEGYTAPGSIGQWYQVYGVLTLPRESGVEEFNDFRITIDNFCFDTNGADYCIDDIRVYQSNSKLTVLQSPAMCATAEERSHVILKVTGNYEILQEQASANTVGHKVRFRFCDENHQPVTGHNFYGPGEDLYGEFAVPAEYSETALLDSVDGNVHQFELDNTGTQQLVLFNRHFDLSPDSVYYLSLQVATGDHEWGEWGVASNICSFYSDNFQLVTQNLVINGQENGRASVMVPCDQETISNYKITMGVTAPDKTNGGKITVPVAFDFYIGSRAEMVARHLDTALGHYRDQYPTSTTGNEAAKGNYSAEDRQLLMANLYSSTNTSGKVYLARATTFTGYPLAAGTDTIVAIAANDSITYGGATYFICQDPMEFVIEGSHDGPALTIGIPGVVYPSSTALPYRAIRIGMPQIRQMGTDGTLAIPVNGRFYAGHQANNEDLDFVGWDNKTRCDTLYLSNTNDPSVDMNRMNVIAFIANNHDDLLHGDSAIILRNINKDLLHEGYWYELEVKYLRTDTTGVENCPGETFFRLKIVPEYATWDPTVTSEFNSNWNVDANWRRSTAAELYKTDYIDYRRSTYAYTLYDANGRVAATKHNPVSSDSAKLTTTVEPKSYVPMYFTKVTVPYLAYRPYPMMPYITYNANTHLIMNMTNGKGNQATENIQYDMMAMPVGPTWTTKRFTSVNFDGNHCAQIQFKSGAQMRMQQYLTYDRAWVEMQMPVNQWATFSTPMMYSYSGEMYVPKATADQTTEAFMPINFNDVDSVNENGQKWNQGDGAVYGLFGKAGDKMYSRIKMPVYQKKWGDGGQEYTGGRNMITSWDNPSVMLIYPSVSFGDNIDLQDNEWYNEQRNAWSHTYNNLRERYTPGLGAAGKIGDDFATPSKAGDPWMLHNAIIRLPKSDSNYQFYYYDQNDSTEHGTGSTSIPASDHFRLGVPYDFTEDSHGEVDVYPDLVRPIGNHYYLIGNPYTSTIRVRDFVDANRNVMGTVRRPVIVNGEETTDSTEVYRVWLLNGQMLTELSPDDESSIIDPGRSFFVKMDTLDANHNQLVFTTRMETDPALHMDNMLALQMQMQMAKKYTVMSPTDVVNAIESGRVTSGFRCWSPDDGLIAIDGGTYSGDWSAQIYTVDGRLAARINKKSDGNQMVAVGRGLYVVRISKADSGLRSENGSETFKIAVR